MGSGSPNAGTEHVYHPTTDAFLGHAFYAGQVGDGHYAPSGDPLTSTSAMNNLRDIAQNNGRTSWEGALPTGVASWYSGLASGYKNKLWRRFLLGPAFAE